MTSKVLVKLPTVPFPQGKKPSSEIVSLSGRNEGLIQTKQQNMNVDRAHQLEQNMKFLQEQHQATLIALHQEVETLRQRNRDLQFQLVFSKGANYTPSSPSSPEDSVNGFAKTKGSPVSVNVTPLQVELLEKDLQDAKTSLQEAKTHNQRLSEVIEQQKMQLSSCKSEKLKVPMADVGIQVGERFDPAQSELAARLEDAEALVKRLRRENNDQKREIVSLKASSANTSSGAGGGGGGGGNGNGNGSKGLRVHNRNSATPSSQDQSSHKFPPLQTQSYWHRSYEHSSDYHRNGRSRYDKQDFDGEVNGTVLPELRAAGMKPEVTNFDSPPYRSQGHHSYYRGGGNRKYRGQMSQRDRRDSDYRYNRREYRDRNPKDHHREFADSAEGSRDSDSRKQ